MLCMEQEVSPLTSGRLSHSSEPLNGGGSLTGTDSPPISPSDEFDDVIKVFSVHFPFILAWSGTLRNICCSQHWLVGWFLTSPVVLYHMFMFLNKIPKIIVAISIYTNVAILIAVVAV